MADGYRNNAAVDASALYDPDVMGDGYNATFLRRTDGTTLKYALAAYGTPGPVLGCRDASGNDAGPKWAAKGTAVYSLPINGQTFTGFSSGAVSSAMLASAKITIASDGTYNVTCIGNSTVTNPANGTWLPSGGSVSNFQVQFASVQQSQGTNGPATITNGAAAYAACTTSRSFETSATTAQHGGLEIGGNYTVTIRIKNVSTGAVSTTTVTFSVMSTGAA